MDPKPAEPSLHPSYVPASKETSRVMTQVTSPEPHLGWHSRGYLPHWDHPRMIQSLNFRLGDSLPQEVLQCWKQELGLLGARASCPQSVPKQRTSGQDARSPREDAIKSREVELRRRIEVYLDAGHGACWLRQPEIASLVEGALHHFDRERYRLLAWCVMPNHVHALIETAEGWPLGEVLHSWKSFVAKKANAQLRRRGEFWQEDYLDRYVRNAEHYENVLAYIEDNPVSAGLAKTRAEWPWSSARFRAEAPGSAGRDAEASASPGGAGILPAIRT